jgi:hypothetical protein
MRTTTAYFAGVGTVVAAVAVGLGGGLLISNIVSPHEPKTEMSKLELRMSKPIAVSNAPSEPVPYLEASQAVPAAANAAQAQPQPPVAPQSAETVAAASPPPDAAPAIEAAQLAPLEQTAAPENALAKARDADVKRVTEKRKAERRQQWTERRRHLPRQDQELRDVEEKVREETGLREAFTAEPVRLEMPRIRLFDPE